MKRFIITYIYIIAISLLTLITVILLSGIRSALQSVKDIVRNTTSINPDRGDFFEIGRETLPLIPLAFIILVIAGFISIYIYRKRR